MSRKSTNTWPRFQLESVLPSSHIPIACFAHAVMKPPVGVAGAAKAPYRIGGVDSRFVGLFAHRIE